MTRRPALLLLLWIAAASALWGQVQITTTSPLPQGYAGIHYTTTFTANVQPPTLTVTWSAPFGPAPELPAGITMSANGTLSGTTSQTGTFTFNVMAQAGNFSQLAQFQLTISGPVIAINTTSPLPNGIQGQFYSLALSASSNPAGVTWSVGNTGLPSQLNLSSNGILSGVPSAAGQYTIQLVATIAGTTISTSQVFLLTVYAGQVTIQTTSLPLAVSGQAYTATLGGTPSGVTWALNGVLPNGIVFNTATGIFSGSTAFVGAYPVQLTASLTNYASATQNLTLYVTSGPLAVPQPTLPPAVQNSPYTTTVGASGGLQPYQWKFVNASNNGLSMSSAGVITGTPVTAGSGFLLLTSLSDATGTSITLNLNLFVASPLSVGTTSLPNGNIGVAYLQNLQGGGGTPPFTWLLARGSLPNGLSLSTAGTISGTPTATGTSTFTVQVTDSGGRTAVGTLSLSIGVTPLGISTNSLPGGQLTVAYSQTLAATGGVMPYKWSLASGTLPQGLTLNSSTGVISGTPAGALGLSTFTIQVTDSSPGTALTVQKAFTINIALTLTITTLSLPNGTKGVAYPAAQILASGGTTPYVWAVVSGALPGGLMLNVNSGVIGGTPTATGTSVFGVVVTDAAGQTASSELNITINPPGTPLSITTSGSFPATVGAVFTQALVATGGTPPYTWSATGLPAGLNVNGSNISGTPTPAATLGSASVTLKVVDSQQATTTAAITINVSPPFALPVSIGAITGAAATQATPSLTLTSTYPFPLTGTLTASFQSAVGGSPTEVGFVTSGGGLVTIVPLTVPANGSNAVFANAPVLATGTVAGTITLTATLSDGVNNLTPSPAPTETITVSPGPPVIETVLFSNSGGALTVTVIGYSTTREMVSGQFQFYTSTGPILTPVTVQLGSAFSTWYQSSASNQYGSQFMLTIPFTVSGNPADVVSVNATIANTKGNSISLSTIPAN